MKRVAIAVLLMAARAAVAQTIPNVDACISRLNPQADIGYDRIAARCPELARQLEQGAWSAWLPRGWKESGNDLSAGSLRELRELAGREAAATVGPRTPEVGRLKAALAGLGNRGVAAEGWWSHFKAWLRSVLESRYQDPGETWFSRMVSRVGFPESVIELISYIALALVLVLAALIVVNELRTAGLLPKRVPVDWRRRGGPVSIATGSGGNDIAAAPIADQPRLLLQLIVKRLGQRGDLPPAGALTVRELSRVARLPDAADRERLASLGLAAERVRFSGGEIPPQALEQPVAGGRELLEHLNAGVGP